MSARSLSRHPELVSHGICRVFLAAIASMDRVVVGAGALAVGPRKLRSSIKRIWSMVFRKRLDPEEILTNVVLQHEQHVKAVREALGKAEAAEAALRKSEAKRGACSGARSRSEATGLRGRRTGRRGRHFTKNNWNSRPSKTFANNWNAIVA